MPGPVDSRFSRRILRLSEFGGKTMSVDNYLEEERDAALDIAIDAGALTRCDFDHDAIGGTGDRVAAYKHGNVLISQRDRSVALFGGDRRAMTDAVKKVMDEFEDADCYHHTRLAYELS